MYQAIYKCRLCGEIFSSTKGIDISDKNFSDYVNWHFQQLPTIKTKHNCQDSSLGLADFIGFRKVEDWLMIEIIYISRYFNHSKYFIENLLTKFKEKDIKGLRYIPENMMIETDKFRIYGLPIYRSCFGLSCSKTVYYIDEMFISDREVAENEYERYKHILQTLPVGAIKIKSEELMEILAGEIEG